MTRRRSFAPKNYTFAPNVTPITYPSDPASPTSNARSSSSPHPDGTDGDIKESADDLAAIAATTTSAAGPSRPRRRGGRKDSIDHIPRPPNAFMLFRQNFVHQRHVPGSIETSHNSLSKIVGTSISRHKVPTAACCVSSHALCATSLQCWPLTNMID